MLGTFSWEFKDVDGALNFRPIFLISDSFVKEHSVKKQRSHHSPNIALSEELNFSNLAIKFSKSLTKDMAFSGVRDIVRKIGEFVDRSYEFEIEFAFGYLRSKERKVTFEFKQSRLLEVLACREDSFHVFFSHWIHPLHSISPFFVSPVSCTITQMVDKECSSSIPIAFSDIT